MSLLLDWAGNPIKDGMEFCIVRISPIYRLRFSGMMYLHGNWEGKIIPCDNYWEPGPYYKIGYGEFTFVRDDESITIATSSLIRLSYQDNRYIIAVRELSDIKELYYGK